MIKDNKIKRIYVKEALVNKNYLSYRIDLMLFKVLISLAVLILTYLTYLDLILSLLTGSLVFSVITLVNKIKVEKKNEKGRELLLKKVKQEYFSSKIEEMQPSDFELLIRLFFNKEGYKNIIKKGRSLYLAEKEGYISCIKIFKLFDGTEIEKIDVRSLLTFMGNSGIRKGFLVAACGISQDAEKLIENLKDKFEINLIDIEGLYSLAEKNKILPEEAFFHKMLNDKKTISKKELKENVLDIRKVYLYIAASVFFYMS
ncbi:MAG: restriction endonuclease, partial [Tissierellia bacterium]|nr:restriction endonuclease [Tissierellia bacterium]